MRAIDPYRNGPWAAGLRILPTHSLVGFIGFRVEIRNISWGEGERSRIQGFRLPGMGGKGFGAYVESGLGLGLRIMKGQLEKKWEPRNKNEMVISDLLPGP